MSCSARSKTACRDITFNAYGIIHIKRKRFRAYRMEKSESPLCFRSFFRFSARRFSVVFPVCDAVRRVGRPAAADAAASVLPLTDCLPDASSRRRSGQPCRRTRTKSAGRGGGARGGAAAAPPPRGCALSPARPRGRGAGGPTNHTPGGGGGAAPGLPPPPPPRPAVPRLAFSPIGNARFPSGRSRLFFSFTAPYGRLCN